MKPAEIYAINMGDLKKRLHGRDHELGFELREMGGGELCLVSESRECRAFFAWEGSKLLVDGVDTEDGASCRFGVYLISESACWTRVRRYVRERCVSYRRASVFRVDRLPPSRAFRGGFRGADVLVECSSCVYRCVETSLRSFASSSKAASSTSTR